MIVLTKLNDDVFLLNPEQIETVTATPDTRIKLLSGNIYIVKETLHELVQKVIEYKQTVLKDAFVNAKSERDI